ncbi:MAG: flagellar basal body L-ring protein FlgH [Gammaproteobacteria bacterium]|nr:MAG: flagellar basal body L-ring protein FlgH [Gammaproteobacteria bacterium]
MKLVQSIFISIAAALLLGACSNTPENTHPDYAAVEPFDPYPEPQALAPTGSIYQNVGHNLVLFEDLRARQVGDILTVVLAEATDGTKSSDTALDKDNSTVIDNPVIAGNLVDLGNDNNLAFDLSSKSAFKGDSASNQSNSLQGSISVTVAKVYPGGNLYVQGEKWIKINQGNEYIRLRGIIRSVDISTSNTILSTKIADARISYSGTGATQDVNKVGWLSRFFISPIWPF